MKNFIFVLVLMTVFSVQAQDTITIVHVNDSHSMLAPLAPRDTQLQGTRGGIARAASVIGLAKAENPRVLALHGGDFFIGDLFFNKYFGIPELQILQGLGIDAMGLGNHEFDLEPATLQTALQTAFPNGGIPLLSANANLDSFPSLKQYIKKYIVKQIGNLKVGIFGLTTQETNDYSLPYPVRFESFEAAAVEAVTTLRQSGCGLVICLSHLGILYDQGLAAALPGIDVILSSHDHSATPAVISITNPGGTQTHIVQTNAFYQQVGKMKIIVGANGAQIANFQLINLDQNVPEEPQTKAMVSALIQGIEATYGPLYSQQVGFATETIDELEDSLTTPGNHDTPLGNLLTDAYRWKTGTQIGILVGGSTAQPIYKGPIVAADVFRSIGYGFDTVKALGYRIVKCSLSGLDIIKGLEFGLNYVEYNDELLPQVSGMRYTYNPEKPAGKRVTSVFIGNSPLTTTQLYSVTCNEFLLFALTELVGVQPVAPYVYSDSTEFEVLTQYIAGQQIIAPLREGRVKFDPQVSSINSDEGIPEDFNLKQNFPNPFNPSTIIRFSIPSERSVSLDIFDITGKCIRTLVNGTLQSGEHEVVFDGRNADGKPLGSGIYFYRLRGAGFSHTKKCILAK